MSEQIQEYSVSEYASVIDYVDGCENDTLIPSQPERFEIKTKDQAAWALRKMSKIKADLAENAAVAQAEIDRIMKWRVSEDDKLQQEMSFFEYLLMGYFQECRKADDKLKTIKLPHGSLKMRAQQPEYAYPPEEDMVVWAEANGDDDLQLVITKKTVDKTKLKAYIKETGDIPNGLTITDRPEKFFVEVI